MKQRQLLFFLLICAIGIYSCAPRRICPAYQTAMILDDDLRAMTFGHFIDTTLMDPNFRAQREEKRFFFFRKKPVDHKPLYATSKLPKNNPIANPAAHKYTPPPRFNFFHRDEPVVFQHGTRTNQLMARSKKFNTLRRETYIGKDTTSFALIDSTLNADSVMFVRRNPLILSDDMPPFNTDHYMYMEKFGHLLDFPEYEAPVLEVIPVDTLQDSTQQRKGPFSFLKKKGNNSPINTPNSDNKRRRGKQEQEAVVNSNEEEE